MFKGLVRAPRVLQLSSPAFSRGIRHNRIFSNLLHSSAPLGLSKNEDEQALPPTFAEKYNLYDPTRWVPITIGSFVLASTTGLYHWDEESQMLGLFVLFVGTVYSQGGAAIGGYLDTIADDILKEQQESENAQIEAVKADIESTKKFLTLDQDIESLVAHKRELADAVTQAVPLSFEHRKANFFAAKLQKIANYEAEARESLQKTLIEKATTHTVQTFEKDDVLKKQSLAAALKWLQEDDASKTQMKEVGDLFTNFFNSVKKDPTITKDLEDKMKSDIQRLANERFEIVDEYEHLTAAK